MVPGCDCFIKSSSSGLMVIFTIAEPYLKTALLSDFNTHTHDTSDRFFFGFLDLVDPSDLHFSVSGQVLTWLTAESQLRVSVNLGTSQHSLFVNFMFAPFGLSHLLIFSTVVETQPFHLT